MPTTRRTALTTTMRVIDRVHRDTANGRTNTAPPGSTGLAELPQVMFAMSDFANRRTAIGMDSSHFTGSHSQCCVGAFTRDDLATAARGAHHLSAFPGLQFDAMNQRTHRKKTPKE